MLIIGGETFKLPFALYLNCIFHCPPTILPKYIPRYLQCLHFLPQILGLIEAD